ncbi:sigma 54-interacting transcriptional regulator [Virgibacillus alimentarius]|uniref:HTH-type transcriptional regulatory protein TyrR n=1 Tax=Virgibacillus alimentarius TaxID=698769 RepID=A0ABS4SBP8_9BACI|nr:MULTISPECIES: sigma 54-interacting transcriptional regulator [Virgibacillus]MBP2258933.1 transcriptional regulator with PAS, ATPase and Fis domain [Virgibacillus alimentarius]HLR69386.1 sigma 54-interacting transcriptional regulator [Virgibacillus sp.]
MQSLYLLPNSEEEIIESYDEDIIVTKRDGTIIKVTRKSGLYYDLSAEELLGQSVYELESKGIFTPAITPLVLKQKKKVAIVQIASNNRKVLITGIPLFNEFQEVEFVISYSYDVSELRLMQEYLAEFEDEMSTVKEELALLRKESLHVEGFICESKSMKQILKMIDKIAPLQVSVVLEGESGVGKTALAKIIHKQSTKKAGPFVTVDCGIIPDALFKRELIGGLDAEGTKKIGFLQMAQSGTLYLQGIDELSLASQTTLLKELQRTNGNFRIITAAEQSLEDLMAAKQFREDLFYYLHVVPIHVLPLRERPEDLRKAFEIYLEKYNGMYQQNKKLSDPLFHSLLYMRWERNFMEVKNLMERLVVQSESAMITEDDLPAEYIQQHVGIDSIEMEGHPLPAILEKVEKEVLLKAQKQYKTTTEMADYLGISQASVVRKLKKYFD